MGVPGDSLIGLETPQFVPKLIQRIPEIGSIRLFWSAPSRPIQEDQSFSDLEHELVAKALLLRSSLGLPFWDAVLLCLSQDPTAAPHLLRRATVHNRQDLDAFVVGREDFNSSQLQTHIDSLPAGKILAMSSRVVTVDGQVRHLPMLDFHCQASSGADELVGEVIKSLGLNGYLVRSGRSYHYYGNSLIGAEDLISFLARSLAFCPIVDRAWISHQLQEGACGLRISKGKNYTECPVVIREL